MPWLRAKLRDSVVFAKATAAGALAIEGGLVEIRYKPRDGRAYKARAANLEVVDAELLADETLGEASPVERANGTNGKTPSAPGPRYAAYTDGACTGNPGPAGLGVVLIAPGGKTIGEGSEYLGEGTNNIAELTAIARALERTPAEDPIIIYTDSQYAIGVLVKGWKAKANRELIEGIRGLMRGRKVALEYVRGHAGVPLNERADELARAAVARRRTQWT